uniref:Uncharacterized protein n=1 Tax=Setaria viridis TaxID=4556 RepID=A0A4U6U091_SETVI|nr:hypothetical protein SEVIR_6G049600v2 [Setaria viridis]TKW08811.1 hypothetical protein SEVIR_6G049600v2 [Setaria viridis]
MPAPAAEVAGGEETTAPTHTGETRGRTASRQPPATSAPQLRRAFGRHSRGHPHGHGAGRRGPPRRHEGRVVREQSGTGELERGSVTTRRRAAHPPPEERALSSCRRRRSGPRARAAAGGEGRASPELEGKRVSKQRADERRWLP